MNPPAPLNLKTTNDASKSWKSFKQSWQIYEIASGTAKREPVVRLATFLHVAGPDALEKYNGFEFESEEERADLDKVIQKFDMDCKSSINILSERNKFYSRKQKREETTDQYVTELRILASTCEFLNTDEALRDQFALNIRDVKAKERLYVEAQDNYRSLTFNKAVSIVKSYELLKFNRDPRETYIHSDNLMEVDKITGSNKQKKINCKYCGKFHDYGKCPAYGKKCLNCSKLNHFKAVCRNNGKVNELDATLTASSYTEEIEKSEEYI